MQFRYHDSPKDTILKQGDYSKILAIHQKTKESCQKRTKALCLINDIKDLKLSGFDEKIDKFSNDLEKEWVFNDNSSAGSYTCAEQTAFQYISDKQILSYLIKKLRTEESTVKGIVVNICCSANPCSTCSISLTRESEAGGILSIIANNKPVIPIFSCLSHYDRPVGMIKYEQTKWLDFLKNKLEFEVNLDKGKSLLPYPVVLLNNHEKKWDIDKEKYNFWGCPS